MAGARRSDCRLEGRADFAEDATILRRERTGAGRDPGGRSPQPTRLAATDFGRLGLEVELAVTLDRLPVGDGPFGPSDITPLISTVSAAFELIDDRNADYSRIDVFSLVADNSWNAGIVTGPAVGGLRDALMGRKGKLTRNGEAFGEGRTEDAGGNPLHVVAWTIETLRRRGHPLLPGQVIMTGSILPTYFPATGEVLRFEIEGMPPTSVEIA